MQSLAFLEKDLFTSYWYDGPVEPEQPLDEIEYAVPPRVRFEVSLTALLETLSILGSTEAAKERFTRAPFTSGINEVRGTSAAFDNRTLGIDRVCRITYKDQGDPLYIMLEEGNMTTTCSLTTYETDDHDDSIPFDRDAVVLKVIMRASVLYDAFIEIHNTTNPERLIFSCNPSTPDCAFALSASGSLGSTCVAFAKEADLLETFICEVRIAQVYKFSMLKSALRAMETASKVSVRLDEQGVLSLQFMVEVTESPTKLSFVDFRFMPFVLDEDEDEEDAVSVSHTRGPGDVVSAFVEGHY